MESEFQTEIASSSEVVHALSPVAAHSHDHIVHFSSSEGGVATSHTQFTSSNSISGQQFEEPAVEADTSSNLGRFLNTEQYVQVIGFVVVVVTQMSGSSEKQRNISLCFLGAMSAAYVLEQWLMTSNVIIFGIVLNFAKLLCFYLLLCILKPEWLSWYGFVIVCIIAIAYTFSDELKTKFTWCCRKGVLVTNYVIDKVLIIKPVRKDQTSPALAPPRASV